MILQQAQHVNVGPTERALIRASVKLYEGNDRYRPGVDRKHYGVAYELQTATGWIKRAQWFRTASQAGALLAEAKAGLTWLGQQVQQGTVRDMRLTNKPEVSRT